MGLGVTPAIVRGARRGARTALARVRFLGCGLGMGPRAFATNLMAVAFAPDSLLCREEESEARGARDDGGLAAKQQWSSEGRRSWRCGLKLERLLAGLPTGRPRGHFGIITFTRHCDSPDQTG